MPLLYFLKIIVRALNHIATINESTSKAVKMYKAFDDETGNEERHAETPLLFIIGDKLKEEDENGGVEKNLKKPIPAWEANKTKKEPNRVNSFFFINLKHKTLFTYFYFRRILRIK